MFDAGAWCSDTAVALLLGLGDRLGGTAFALDLHSPASRCQRGFALGARVTAIRIDVTAGVGRIEQVFKHHAVGNGSMGDDDFAYELVAFVDACVKLVAEV